MKTHARRRHARPDRERAAERALRDGRGRPARGHVADDPRAARRVPDDLQRPRPDGRRPVRLLHPRGDRPLRRRHRRGRRDPAERPVPLQGLDLALQRLARDPADLLRGQARRVRVALRPHDGRGREGPRQPGLGRALDLGGGHPDPADQDLRPRRPQRDGARRDPQQHAHAGHEPERPDGDHRRLPRGRAADRRDLRALRRRRRSRPRATRCSSGRARAMAHIIRTYIPEEPATFTDWVDDDGLGNGPVQDGADDLARGRRLPRRLDGHRRPGARLDQLPHPRGPLQALPRDLHDHGVRPRDPLQRRDLRRLRGDAAGGLAAEPEVPGAAVEPAERPHAPLRLHERRARPEGARALDGGRLRDEPVLRLLGLRRAPASTSSSSSCCSAGCRPGYSADGLDGHSWWPLFRTTPAEYAESYYPVRISSYVPARDTGGAGLHRGGTGDREDVRVPRARARSRSTTTAPRSRRGGSTAGATAAAARRS